MFAKFSLENLKNLEPKSAEAMLQDFPLRNLPRSLGIAWQKPLLL
jgi:hypothetical protein